MNSLINKDSTKIFVIKYEIASLQARKNDYQNLTPKLKHDFEKYPEILKNYIDDINGSGRQKNIFTKKDDDRFSSSRINTPFLKTHCRSQSYRTVACKFYAIGICKYGEDCRFLHESNYNNNNDNNNNKHSSITKFNIYDHKFSTTTTLTSAPEEAAFLNHNHNQNNTTTTTAMTNQNINDHYHKRAQTFPTLSSSQPKFYPYDNPWNNSRAFVTKCADNGENKLNEEQKQQSQQQLQQIFSPLPFSRSTSPNMKSNKVAVKIQSTTKAPSFPFITSLKSPFGNSPFDVEFYSPSDEDGWTDYYSKIKPETLYDPIYHAAPSEKRSSLTKNLNYTLCLH